MQPATNNATLESPPDELLIFIGHSDDAAVEAQAIWELQTNNNRKVQALAGSEWTSFVLSECQILEMAI